jgi:predicted nucleic acid-binding protein
MTRIYLDSCCLNRPFDDQSQDRVRLESEAILLILAHVEKGEWIWISSELVIVEIEQTPDIKRRQRTLMLIRHVDESVTISDDAVRRSKTIEKLGFSGFDALHLACAENEKADIFLTTDDKLLKRAKRLSSELSVRVENPLSWLKEMIK